VSTSSTDVSPEDTGYTRGVRLASVDAGRVIRIFLALCLLSTVVLAAVLTASAAGDDDRLNTLRHHGVPVVVTVTDCLGVGASINIGVQYWQCHGDYTLAGRKFHEVIGGNRAQLDAGSQIQAVAVAGQPSLLSTTASIGPGHSLWAPFVTPVILWGAVVLALGGWGAWWLRRKQKRSVPEAVSTGSGPQD